MGRGERDCGGDGEEDGEEVAEEEKGSEKDPQISSISWLSSSIFHPPEEGGEEEKGAEGGGGGRAWALRSLARIWQSIQRPSSLIKTRQKHNSGAVWMVSCSVEKLCSYMRVNS